MKIKITLKIKLVILIIIAFQNLGVSCSCGIYETVFCRIANHDHHIIRAVVSDSTINSIMEVKLIENINNEILGDTILIYGQDGLTCGETLTQFSYNDTLILALHEWVINGQEFWYLEGFCGIHFLRYENGMVKGQITDSLTIQPIQEFKDNLFTCLDMKVPTEEVEILEQQVSVFPNPIKENFQIISIQNEISGYEIFNSNGQLIEKRNFNKLLDTIDVSSNNLGNGMYYIRIITPKGILTKKILKL